MYIVSYLLVLVLSLRRDGQRLSATVDKGQSISLRCDMIFAQLVFAPFEYMWREENMFTNLATTAVYNIIADSDFNYQCRARAFDQKGRPIQVRGTILLTVRGTYLLWCSNVFSVFVNTPVWNNEPYLGLCQICQQ